MGEQLRRRAERFLFGDDVFVSYARFDTGPYALALASALTQRRLSCFVDQWGTPPGATLPSELLTALRRSSLLVVIASPASASSAAVGQEIEAFLQTGRPIVLVDVGGALGKAEWYPSVKGIAETREPGERFERAAPSPQVVERIVNAEGFRSRSARLRRTFWATLIATAVVLAAGGAISYVVVTRAQTQVSAADAQRAEAERGRDAATTVREQAVKETHAARESLAVAERETARQSAIAEAETRRATREGTIAGALQLANRADVLRSQPPNRLADSTLAAIEALRQLTAIGVRSPVADSALRNSLGLLPDVRATLHVPAGSGPIALSPDGRHLARVGARDVEIVETAKGTVERRVPANGEVLALSRGGRLLAFKSGRGVRLVDSGSEWQHSIELFEDFGVVSAALDPDGAHVALLIVAEEWRFVEIWHVATGAKIVRLPGPSGSEAIFSVAFGPTGQTLAIGGHATSGGRRLGYAHVWNLERRSRQDKMLSPGDFGRHRTLYQAEPVRVVAPGAEWHVLATSAADGVRLWQAVAGSDDEEVARLQATGTVAALGLDEKANSLRVVARGPGAPLALTTWEPSGGRQLLRKALTEKPAALHFGERILSVWTPRGDGPQPAVQAWSLDGQPVGPAAIGADTRAAPARAGRYRVDAFSAAPTVLDLLTPRSLAVRLGDELSRVAASQVSHDGAVLLLEGWTRARQRMFAVYRRRDEAYGDPQLLPRSNDVVRVRLSPDGRLVALADGAGTVWLQPLGRGAVQPRGPLRCAGALGEVTFSPDGRWLLTITQRAPKQDAAVAELWDVARAERRWAPTPIAKFRKAVFSTEGQLAITGGDGRLAVWRLPQPEPVPLSADSGLGEVTFSPDGQIVAAAGNDFTVRIWDVASRAEIVRLPHAAQVTELAFSARGSHVATATVAQDVDFARADDAYVVRVFLLQPEDLVRETCRRLRLQPVDPAALKRACSV